MTESGQYMNGYLFEHEGQVVGFATVAKTFSTEAGGLVAWLEELYIRPNYRSLGLGKEIFEYIENSYSNIKRIRLEVERDNVRAMNLYKKKGFHILDYLQMVKDF